MKLRTAKRVCDVLVVLYAIAFVLLYLLPDSMKGAALGTVIALTVALATVNLAFMRCPYCRAQVHRWGMDFCPKCGRKLENE